MNVAIHPPRPVDRLAPWWGAVLLGLLGAATALLVSRRLAGALHNPLGNAWLIAAGLATAGLAAAGREAYRRALRRASRAARLGVAVIASLVVLTLGAALSPQGAGAGLVVFWTLLLAEEAFAWRPGALSVAPAAEEPLERHADEATTPQGTISLYHAVDEDAVGEPPASQLPPGEVLQQLTLSRAADGGQELSGWLRLPIAKGQRTGSVHVAFCPPFGRTPEVSIEQADGPEARVKPGQLLPYGVRLDLKLVAAADQPGSVLLRFAARG